MITITMPTSHYVYHVDQKKPNESMTVSVYQPDVNDFDVLTEVERYVITPRDMQMMLLWLKMNKSKRQLEVISTRADSEEYYSLSK